MVQVYLKWRHEHVRLDLAPKAFYVIGRDPTRCDLVIPNHWQGCSRLQAELL